LCKEVPGAQLQLTMIVMQVSSHVDDLSGIMLQALMPLLTCYNAMSAHQLASSLFPFWFRRKVVSASSDTARCAMTSGKELSCAVIME
jgi:hypothetical protein